MKQCAICKCPFDSKLSNRRKYCGSKCADEGNRRYMRKYMREYSPRYHPEYWQLHPQKRKRRDQLHRALMQRKRLTIIHHYGAICVCCGESHLDFLTIDHINNDGAMRRKTKQSQTGEKEYYRIIREGFPDDVQILCMNCNYAKGRSGKRYCPVHHPELYDNT